MSVDMHTPHTPEMTTFVDLLGNSGSLRATRPHMIIVKNVTFDHYPHVFRGVVELDVNLDLSAQLHALARTWDIAPGWALYAVPVAGMAVA